MKELHRQIQGKKWALVRHLSSDKLLGIEAMGELSHRYPLAIWDGCWNFPPTDELIHVNYTTLASLNTHWQVHAQITNNSFEIR